MLKHTATSDNCDRRYINPFCSILITQTKTENRYLACLVMNTDRLQKTYWQKLFQFIEGKLSFNNRLPPNIYSLSLGTVVKSTVRELTLNFKSLFPSSR